MGWASLHRPGTRYGPCDGRCRHVDCARTRAMAATLCVACADPIGYDRPFYDVGPEVGRVAGVALAHTVCWARALRPAGAGAQADPR